METRPAFPYAISRSRIPAGQGPKPCIHYNEDVGLLLLRGALPITAGNRKDKLRARGFVNIRSGAPFRTIASESDDAEFLQIVAPTGFDRYQREAGLPLESWDTPAGLLSREDID